MSSRNRFIAVSSLYVVASLAMMGIGFFYSLKVIEFSGFMILAGTFLPLPADTYIIHLTPYLGGVYIALIGGAFNTIAVLFEKYFVSHLLLSERGEKIKKIFNESKFSLYFAKYPALTLFVTAFSFLPYEPFRFLAITNNYSNVKYSFATFFGRGIRYWVLTIFGNFMAGYRWLAWIIAISLIFYFISLFKSGWINND